MQWRVSDTQDAFQNTFILPSMLVLPIARFCITIIIIAAAAAATTTTTTATAYYYPSLPSRKIALIPIRYR